MNDQILEMCNEEQDPNVKKILDILKIKYGRTELEKIEKLWDYLVIFKIDQDLPNDVILEKIKK